MELRVAKQTDSNYAFTNLLYMNPADFNIIKSKGADIGADDNQVLIELSWAGGHRSVVYAATRDEKIPQGQLGFNGDQRNNLSVSLDLLLTAKPFRVPACMTVQTLTLSVEPLQKPASDTEPWLELEVPALEKMFARMFKGQILTIGQRLLLKLKKTLVVTVQGFDFMDLELVGGATDGAADRSRGQFSDRSCQLTFERAGGAKVKLVGGTGAGKAPARNIFNKQFDFNQMGIGGLDSEFNTIFKRAFASRIFPEHVVEQLGIHHVRGMLLYGPPGCGKTLIARQIGKVLNAREPKIVNGPEILDKFVGGSEQKIRDLFADAEAEQKAEGSNSMLHIIIFDEFDAICKSRGSTGDSTGVHDSIVNQLLSKIDGVDSINNVLIIGMTNRKDMIDDAILRPGRLEVHVEIGLPDAAGRLQILKIHTANMAKAAEKRIADDCVARLPELAERTKNFSGAELSGLVRAATSTAMDRCVNKETMTVDASKLCVEFGDFETALGEVQPKFGAPTADLETYFAQGIVEYGRPFAELQAQLGLAVKQVERSAKTPLLTVLLEGDTMTGKTAIAAYTAVHSGFPLVRFVTADTLIGMGEAGKCHHLQKVFMDSYKSPLSVVILNDLERLIEYTPLGPRFSNMVLQTLLVLLKKPPPPPHRLLVVATTAIAHLLEDVQLVSAFHLKVHVPRLEKADCEVVLKPLMSPSDLAEVMGYLTKPIALKQLLMVAEMARQDDDSISTHRFAEALSAVIGDD